MFQPFTGTESVALRGRNLQVIDITWVAGPRN